MGIPNIIIYVIKESEEWERCGHRARFEGKGKG